MLSTAKTTACPGRKPIEFIQATNPIVIIDEPQSVDNTDKAKRAIANLNPIACLRYSATHRNPYNLLYRLTPIDAYDQRLVKRIEVASVRSDDNLNAAYVKLLATDNKKGIQAQVKIHKQKAGRVKPTIQWVKLRDDLYTASGEREEYRNNMIIQTIDCTPGAEYIELSNGQRIGLGQEIGGLRDDIMRVQVEETVEQHLKKELMLQDKNIKVLSLFFIDRVANYRAYNEDGTIALGKIGRWFEEAYRQLTAKPTYKQLVVHDIATIHNGYFSQDKRGRVKDTNGKTIGDEDTYNLIMRDKERLLDPQEPLRFIFSHSALREGWDNPNVFQICTLNESQSVYKKRQEIGRGLRLPVNGRGERIHDENVNRLTIVANESYEDFAKSLQREFEEDLGTRFECIEKITFAKIIRLAEDGTEVPIGQGVSAEIWQRLHKAGYIGDDGTILDTFEPENPHFELHIGDEYSDIATDITDQMERFIFKNRVRNAHARQRLTLRKEVYLSDEFKKLWDTIKQRTRYRVTFDTDELITKAAMGMQAMEPIELPYIDMTRTGVDIIRRRCQYRPHTGTKNIRYIGSTPIARSVGLPAEGNGTDSPHLGRDIEA